MTTDSNLYNLVTTARIQAESNGGYVDFSVDSQPMRLGFFLFREYLREIWYTNKTIQLD